MQPLTYQNKPIDPQADLTQRGIAEFKKRLRGEVYSDQVTRGVYATDASHYQVMPACVVVPKDEDDLIQAVQIACEYELPITPRGGGTSLSGQTTWSGVVIDVSKYCNQVLSIDPDAKIARVQPGLVLDVLNTQLKPMGLHFAPDPATSSRATLGGMIGNNSSGTRSIRYGKTSDHVLGLKVVTGDGQVLVLGEGKEDDLTNRIFNLVWANRDEIQARYPKVMRRVSGYALDTLLDQQMRSSPRSLVPLFVGSEGTLGVVVEATIRLTPLPKAKALVIGHFDEALEALRHVQPLVEHEPSAVELLDSVVCQEAKRNPATKHMAGFIVDPPRWLDDDFKRDLLTNKKTPPQANLLICEFEGDDLDEAACKARAVAEQMQAKGIGYAWPVCDTPEAITKVWEVRKLGLGLISNKPGPVKGQAFIEDACVPLPHLADYIAYVEQVCAREEVELSIYAHASVGVIHCRPMLDLHVPEHVQKMKRIAEACFDKVMAYGGSWASEHGDGFVRGEFIERFYGPVITDLFHQIKNWVDPKSLMNPGKIVHSEPMDAHLRYAAYQKLNQDDSQTQTQTQTQEQTQTPLISTRFGYEKDGGLLHAVEQCNGVGACRKTLSGTMCPSFAALKDETHSTRGRANALRLALTGQLDIQSEHQGLDPKQALASDALHDVLGLCLSCKACQSECPNQVDMAKFKAEALQARYDVKGTPLSARLIAGLPKLAALGVGPQAKWLSKMMKWPVAKRFLWQLGKIDPSRSLPRLANRRWRGRRQTQKHARQGARHQGQQHIQPQSSRGKVILFADTYLQFFSNTPGDAAVRLLEKMGYEVQVARVGCCQRPAISQGLLDQAKRAGLQTFEQLAKLDSDAPIVVVEPSCLTALKQDLPDLIGQDAHLRTMVEQVKQRVELLDVFLLDAIEDGAPWPVKLDQTYVAHAHCHQKASYAGSSAYVRLLELAGADVKELDAGCCGMAGAFGYQHADVSQLVLEDRLLPAAQEAQVKGHVMAVSGISCQHQLEDAAIKQTMHWAMCCERGLVE